ncbi:MAG: aminoacyl-tRNA hydrolase [bacterium]
MGEISLVVGLGNPGRRYQNTWHNLGWRVVEELAKRWRITFTTGRAPYQEAKKGDMSLILPMLFMNRSGEALLSYLRYHKCDMSRILVIYDDHDLPFGEIKIRTEGASGGHKGMEDIIRHLGTTQIPRVRLGIRQLNNNKAQSEDKSLQLAQLVLSPIPLSLREKVNRMISVAGDSVEMILTSGISKAMNFYNGKNWLNSL